MIDSTRTFSSTVHHRLLSSGRGRGALAKLARSLRRQPVPEPAAPEPPTPKPRPSGWWDLLPFTSHRIALGDGLWTADGGLTAHDDARIEILLELCGGSLAGKTILDLGCNEGAFAVEFARRGAAHVIGVEARRANFERCELVRNLLRLTNLEFLHADVKDVLPDWKQTHGQAPDIVFLSGLLYHLSDPYSMLAAVYDVAGDIVLIDTHIADPETSSHGCSEVMSRSWGGRDYRGRIFTEYSADIAPADHEDMLWAAWSNSESFWLLADDLVRMCRDIGFSSVERIDHRGYRTEWHVDKTNRILVVCRKRPPF